MQTKSTAETAATLYDTPEKLSGMSPFFSALFSRRQKSSIMNQSAICLAGNGGDIPILQEYGIDISRIHVVDFQADTLRKAIKRQNAEKVQAYPMELGQAAKSIARDNPNQRIDFLALDFCTFMTAPDGDFFKTHADIMESGIVPRGARYGVVYLKARDKAALHLALSKPERIMLKYGGGLSRKQKEAARITYLQKTLNAIGKKHSIGFRLIKSGTYRNNNSPMQWAVFQTV